MTDDKYIIKYLYKIKGDTNWKEMDDKKYLGHHTLEFLDIIAGEENLAPYEKHKIQIKKSYWKQDDCSEKFYYLSDIEVETYEYMREIVWQAKFIDVEKL